MRIISENYADSITLVPSNVDAAYPITNVQDQRLSTKFHSTTTSVYITVNTASVESEPLAIALLGHNLTSSATVVFQLSEFADFSTVASQIMTWNEGIILKFIDESSMPAELLTETGVELLTETGDELWQWYNYIYNRFYISDATNPDGYISLGRVWVGPYLNITPSSLLDFGVTLKNSDTNIYGKDRQKFSLPGVVWRKFDLTFPPTETAMIDKILDLIDYAGRFRSLIFCNFDEIRDYQIVEPCYVSITDDIGFTHEEQMKFSYGLTLEEDL